MTTKSNKTWHLGGFTANYNRRHWGAVRPTGEELKPVIEALANYVETALTGRSLPVGAVVALLSPVPLPLHPFALPAAATPLLAQWKVVEAGRLELDVLALWRHLQTRLVARRN